MDSATTQVSLLWLAVAVYAAGAVVATASMVFRLGGRWPAWVLRLAAAGLAPQGAAILLRWAEVGHGPYITFYEVASSDTWVTVALFALVAWRYPRVRLAGMFVLPVCFLLVGAAVMAPKEGRELLPVLRSFWLVLHVTFAKLAYGPYLLGLGTAVLYLWSRRNGVPSPISSRFSDAALLDDLSYRMVAFGFLMHAIMIIAGAIWAKQAWGSYWNWDSIETWSLVSWLGFAVVLHLRLVHNWHGTEAALATVGAVVLVVFAFIAVPFLGGSHQILLAS